MSMYFVFYTTKRSEILNIISEGESERDLFAIGLANACLTKVHLVRKEHDESSASLRKAEYVQTGKIPYVDKRTKYFHAPGNSVLP